MTRVDEIRIDMRARNNRLIKLREDMGWDQKQGAEACGVSPQALGRLENLRGAPVKKSGDWKSQAKRIAALYGVDVEWIWPEQMRDIRAQAISRTIASNKAMQWDGWRSSKPMLAVEREEVGVIIDRAFDEVLSGREARVLRDRFGEMEKGYSEIGREIGLCGQSIRMIEAKALRKLKRRGGLGDYADGIV